MTEDYSDPNKYKRLSNGAVYDLVGKRIVANPGGGSKAFTSVTASQAVRERIQRKRERMQAGANAALDKLQPGEWGDGEDGRAVDLDYAEALAEAAMVKALNSEDPKQIDAARFLLQETGISDGRGVDDPASPVADVRGLLEAMADVVRELRLGSDNSNYQNHGVVDGLVVSPPLPQPITPPGRDHPGPGATTSHDE